MTRLTDEEIGDLLRDTFADHEHLADPDRAVTLAGAAPPPSHRGRALLAAAAAVALVAGGTSYALTRATGPAGPSAGATPSPATTGQPPLPELQTDAENRAAAVAEAERTLEQVPVHPGAKPSGPIPRLSYIYSVSGPASHTVTRTAWWTLPGATPQDVVRWYLHHSMHGYVSDGPGSASGTGDPTVQFTTYTARDLGGRVSPSRLDVIVESTTTPSGTGVRVSVQALWPPARPATSYVQDVSSIDVRSSRRVIGTHPSFTQHSYTVSDPARVLRAVTAYNSLLGMTPEIHSCPLQMDTFTDRITFHTARGDVVAVNRTQTCGFGMTVHRDGRRVDPQLGDPARLFAVLGLEH